MAHLVMRASFLLALGALTLAAASANASDLVIGPVAPVGVAPARVGTEDLHSEAQSEAFYCGGFDPAGRGDTTVIRLNAGTPAVAGAVGVGFSRFHDPGTEPFPCWLEFSHMLTGKVLFNLPNIAGPDGACPTATPKCQRGVLRQARLVFSEVDMVATVPRPECFSALGRIGANQLPFAAGVRVEPAATTRAPRPVAVGPLIRFTRGVSRHDIDVTTLVRDWMEGVRPNNGFALIGRGDAIAARTATCESLFRNFQLLLSF